MSSDIVAQTDRLYMAIGRVVVEFQFVENVAAECLASLMRMREHEDQHRVAAAMSFRQKVDLLCDMYPRRKNAKWPDVEIDVARKSLFAAEEFRNAVVHSFWHVSGSDSLKWMRSKSTLRTSAGLKITAGEVNIKCIESGAKALYTVRDWYLGDSGALTKATKVLKTCTQTLSS
jgi:hypothetical protein